ncbi:MAG: hypothetical protein KC503_07875 [Myxococcales bacterium]|nr:hypothetical protein [Myxococcales bacterium]
MTARKTLAMLLSLAALVSAAPSAEAFKPAPPPKRVRFRDRKAKATLTVFNKSWRPHKVTLSYAGKTYTWPKPFALPATVIISVSTQRVVALGGYGNSCGTLGRIGVYDFKGKLLKSIDLRRRLANLENVSRAYTKICCPCRWIHKLSLTKDGSTLNINVCKKHLVSLALTSLRLSVVR